MSDLVEDFIIAAMLQQNLAVNSTEIIHLNFWLPAFEPS